MAEKKAEAVQAAPAKKGKMLWIVLGLLLAGGGAGGWLFLKPKPAAAGAEQPQKVATEARKAAVYYKFDPAFVVNFGADGNSRFLQVTVEAMSRDPLVLESIKGNEPAIRNDLVLLFSSQQYDILITAEGKEQLRQATLEAIRTTVAAEGGAAQAIENVYFTSLVIQ